MKYPSKNTAFKGILEIENTKLKWYHLAKNLEDITENDYKNAVICIQKHAEIFENSKELGFVILHRCGEIYLLLVCSWRNENEIWETVYHNSNGNYELMGRKEPHLPTFCVWEMGITYHEAKSWKKYLENYSETEYLEDIFEGEV